MTLSPDGVHLYAVSEEERKLLSLDAATGNASRAQLIPGVCLA
jgi:hypothetical protein